MTRCAPKTSYKWGEITHINGLIEWVLEVLSMLTGILQFSLGGWWKGNDLRPSLPTKKKSWMFLSAPNTPPKTNMSSKKWWSIQMTTLPFVRKWYPFQVTKIHSFPEGVLILMFRPTVFVYFCWRIIRNLFGNCLVEGRVQKLQS